MHTYTAPKSTSELQAHWNYLLTYGPGPRAGRCTPVLHWYKFPRKSTYHSLFFNNVIHKKALQRTMQSYTWKTMN